MNGRTGLRRVGGGLCLVAALVLLFPLFTKTWFVNSSTRTDVGLLSSKDCSDSFPDRCVSRSNEEFFGGAPKKVKSEVLSLITLGKVTFGAGLPAMVALVAVFGLTIAGPVKRIVPMVAATVCGFAILLSHCFSRSIPSLNLDRGLGFFLMMAGCAGGSLGALIVAHSDSEPDTAAGR